MATENSEATVTPESTIIPEEATENPETTDSPKTSTDNRLSGVPTLYHLNVSLVPFLTAPLTDLFRLLNPNASSGFSKSSTSNTTYSSSPAIPKPTSLPPTSSRSNNAENAPS